MPIPLAWGSGKGYSMKDGERSVVDWPASPKLQHIGWVIGALAVGWFGISIGAGWFSLLMILFGAFAGAVAWVTACFATLALGKAIEQRAPSWLAVVTQVITFPLLLLIAILWFGSGDASYGRYPSP